MKHGFIGSKAYSLYKEGNPEPFILQDKNKGIPSQILNDLYSPALFRILVRAENNSIDVLMLIVGLVTLVAAIVAAAASTGMM